MTYVSGPSRHKYREFSGTTIDDARSTVKVVDTDKLDSLYLYSLKEQQAQCSHHAGSPRPVRKARRRQRPDPDDDAARNQPPRQPGTAALVPVRRGDTPGLESPAPGAAQAPASVVGAATGTRRLRLRLRLGGRLRVVLGWRARRGEGVHGALEREHRLTPVEAAHSGRRRRQRVLRGEDLRGKLAPLRSPHL